MCPPEHYAILPDPEAGHANDLSVAGERAYRKDPAGFRIRAMRKWTTFRQILERELGATIIEIEPEPGLTEQVFAADASLSLVLKDSSAALMSRFTYSERQAEVEAHKRALLAFDPDRILHYADHPIEGCGDNVYDPYRDLFWSGCTDSPSRQTAGSGRSDARAHTQLAQITGVEVIGLNIQRPFFHLDTALAVLPSGHIMCCRDGLSNAAYQQLIQRAFAPFGLGPHVYLIEVSDEDASRYACNIIAHENHLVLPPVSDALVTKLKQRGYEPITTNLDEFILAGGGPHCLTNQINERRLVRCTADAGKRNKPEASATS